MMQPLYPTELQGHSNGGRASVRLHEILRERLRERHISCVPSTHGAGIGGAAALGAVVFGTSIRGPLIGEEAGVAQQQSFVLCP